MVRLFGKKKTENPVVGFGAGQWEWFDKDEGGTASHTLRRAFSLSHVSKGGYKGEWKEGRPHGIGVLEISSNHRYEGQWEDGKPHGTGKCKYPDGTSYEGEFKLGVPHGRGERTGPYDTKEIGMFLEGKLHGQGKTINDEGDVYEGDFVEGVPNGQGSFTFADGDWFKGMVKNGLPVEGECHQTVLADGQFADSFFEYEGTVRQGMWNGKGTLTLYDKAGTTYRMRKSNSNKLYTYTGDFKNGKFHGNGRKEQIQEGWVYEGEWRDDVIMGTGKLMYKGGSVFEGSFVNGKVDGEAEFVGADRQYKKGWWRAGSLEEGEVRMNWEDGRTYQGGYANKTMHGEGVMTWPSGEKLAGTFVEGCFPQEAELTAKDGTKKLVTLEHGWRNMLDANKAESGVMPAYRSSHAPNAS
eukprot:CAMPEP_0181318732 /NCGR_PEP_ID=MMETSP1101-20121128/17169_1 /TAXON_ID=46948 /ORGANISM="Rhodomonas abbreviata, Strain Caron Lab Isolate" /LENGTH=409 /DNA_ID=CAMNT_0023426233 /DNA_START=102 /DNA_END=1331 /DNA_ORIENTATION=+